MAGMTNTVLEDEMNEDDHLGEICTKCGEAVGQHHYDPELRSDDGYPDPWVCRNGLERAIAKVKKK